MEPATSPVGDLVKTMSSMNLARPITYEQTSFSPEEVFAGNIDLLAKEKLEKMARQRDDAKDILLRIRTRDYNNFALDVARVAFFLLQLGDPGKQTIAMSLLESVLANARGFDLELPLFELIGKEKSVKIQIIQAVVERIIPHIRTASLHDLFRTNDFANRLLRVVQTGFLVKAGIFILINNTLELEKEDTRSKAKKKARLCAECLRKAFLPYERKSVQLPYRLSPKMMYLYRHIHKELCVKYPAEGHARCLVIQLILLRAINPYLSKFTTVEMLADSPHKGLFFFKKTAKQPKPDQPAVKQKQTIAALLQKAAEYHSDEETKCRKLLKRVAIEFESKASAPHPSDQKNHFSGSNSIPLYR